MFFLAGTTDFCKSMQPILDVVGTVVTIFKIAIPVILIILGSIELGKAVIASKDDEIKKATSGLIKRVIGAVVIFFIPTISDTWW